MFSPSIFLFSSRKKEKKTKKKKNAEKGRSFPLSSHSTLSLLAPTFALLLLPFCFKHFLLASFSSQVKEKKEKHKEKKNQRKKKCREEKEFIFLLSLLHLG
jgi:hypothetical protein